MKNAIISSICLVSAFALPALGAPATAKPGAAPKTAQAQKKAATASVSAQAKPTKPAQSSAAPASKATPLPANAAVSAQALIPAEARGTKFENPKYSEAERQQILDHYRNIDPDKIIPKRLREGAILYFHHNQKLIKNQRYLSVIDFSQHSSKKRFFVIDMKSGGVWPIVVAHGRGSEPVRNGYAQRFGNEPRAYKTSLGVYVTAETYQGKYGLSLRLNGVSSTNYLARQRAVVIHGAHYVRAGAPLQGRSFGCPAVPMDVRTRLIERIKGGSVIYAGREPIVKK